MNTFELGCAVLSASVYQYGRPTQNRVAPVPGATELRHVVDASSGFEASVYSYQGKFVVAFAGTDPSQRGDLAADVLLGAGIMQSQLVQAAEFYQQVKTQYGPNVIFTGHSLGGGLASLMGVLFDKPAVTFDPAPFRLSATRSVANTLASRLTSDGWGIDPDLAAFSTTETALAIALPSLIPALIAASAINTSAAATLALKNYPTVIRGESNISAFAIIGEFLTDGYQGLGSDLLNALRIKSGTAPSFIGMKPAGVSGMDLHSQALLIAAATAPELVSVIQKMPAIAVAYFEGGPYFHKAGKSDTDFLVKLVNSEYGNSNAATGIIAKYVKDLQKLTLTSGAAAQAGFQESLLVAAMDYYYIKDASSATALFSASGGAINFNYNDIGADDLKSRSLLSNATTKLDEESAHFIRSYAQDTTGWHIQSGTGALSWAASSSDNQAAVGGADSDSATGGDGDDMLIGLEGADTLQGKAGSDLLVGGDGADQLDGGEGRDFLYGGAGSDTYAFSGDFGNDWIIDSDGSGQITVDGQALSAQNAKKISANTYRDKSTGWTFFKGDVQADGTATLIISKEGARNSSITVRNWKSGQLGITLNDTQEAAPTGVSVFKGDQRPLIYGVELIDDSKSSNTYIRPRWNTANGMGRGDDESILWRDGRIRPMMKNCSIASNVSSWEMVA